MEDEEAIAREVIESNSPVQMREYAARETLRPYHPEENTADGCDNWMAPNLIVKSNLVVNSEIEQYLSPMIGSLCTIRQDSFGSRDGDGPALRLDTDSTKPVFPFGRKEGTRVLEIGETTAWRSRNTFSGVTSFLFLRFFQSLCCHLKICMFWHCDSC